MTMSTQHSEYLTACEHCGKIFLEDNPRKVHEYSCAGKGISTGESGGESGDE